MSPVSMSESDKDKGTGISKKNPLELNSSPTSNGDSNNLDSATSSNSSPPSQPSKYSSIPVNRVCITNETEPTNDNRRDTETPFNSTSGGSFTQDCQSINDSSLSITSIENNETATRAFNWQSSKTTVQERLASLFNCETLADVHFIVGHDNPPNRIPAHKFVLSIGSPVFDVMFNGQLTSEEDIEIPDITDIAAFMSLLRFLYTDEVVIGPETVMTTLYAAKKYAVPILENSCVEFLKQNLSPDNAFMLLMQSRLFDENALAQMCLDTIDKSAEEALEAEGFVDIDHATLISVLERNTLRIKEINLFKSVIKWAKAECTRQNLPANLENQRKVLGKALYAIRFPLMTIEEFASDVVESGILTDRECVNLFLHFVRNPKPTIEFPEEPRSCVKKEEVVCRFARTDLRWGYSGTSDRIRFVVDRRIYIVGFGLYGSIHGVSDYQCTIQIIHTGTSKVLASNDTGFTCDGSSRTFRVMFKKPVEIEPDVNYTACATLKGSDSHYGAGGSRKVVVDLICGGKVTFHFSYAAGCNNGTSIEDGQIPELIFYT
ncbi:BTB/POZ domain-containing protein 1-like [Panonychus citri]|uniref:BTB/POZ domain-containing protein 1-like n=1 Tax=Panonychus citri TaxID=50023 RepID=UPI00230719DD|nr:BTB/POZ domain-containing protein 1-like [Panonychus citri]